MTDEQKNEEAHGLWELAIARLAAQAADAVDRGDCQRLAKAVLEEREAFKHWREVLERVTK